MLPETVSLLLTCSVGMTFALISPTHNGSTSSLVLWREEASSLHSNDGVSIRKRMDYEELCI